MHKATFVHQVLSGDNRVMECRIDLKAPKKARFNINTESRGCALPAGPTLCSFRPRIRCSSLTYLINEKSASAKLIIGLMNSVSSVACWRNVCFGPILL